MKRISCLISLFLCLILPLAAQFEKDGEPFPINEGGLIGIGSYNLKDTYLSPGKNMNYTGWGIKAMNERMKIIRPFDYKVSRQQILNFEIAFTDNPTETATNFACLIDYSLGYHYRFKPFSQLKILTGASVRAMGGFIYNSRNGNNPISAKADVDLNISAMAIYGLNVGNYPLTFRYQAELPFLGVFFSPHYGQSYYEIFNLGNYSGVIKANSFHNKFSIRNYLTVDFPVFNVTVRAGYLHNYYSTDVNDLQTHIVSHSFVIGLVKEFNSIVIRRAKDRKKHKSAFY